MVGDREVEGTAGHTISKKKKRGDVTGMWKIFKIIKKK